MKDCILLDRRIQAHQSQLNIKLLIWRNRKKATGSFVLDICDGKTTLLINHLD